MMKIKIAVIAVLVLFGLGGTVFAMGPSQDCVDNLNEATALMQQNNFVEAKELLQQLLTQCPPNPYIYGNIGIIAVTDGELDKAKSYFDQAQKTISYPDANTYLLYYNIGLCYYRLGEYNQAIKIFKESTNLNNNFSYSQYNLGLSYLKDGDSRNGIAHLKRALTLFQKENNTHFAAKAQGLLQFFSESGSSSDKLVAVSKEDAIRIIKRPIDVGQEIEEISAMFEAGQDIEAMELMRQHIKENPDSVEGHYRLGVMYLASDDYANAATLFTKVIEKDPSHAQAYINLGSIYGKQALYDKALPYMAKALEIDPTNSHLCYNLSLLYKKIGDMKKARTFFNQALNLASEAQEDEFVTYLIQIKPKLF
jgi:tetratricopeptide (TPR) repeat protein